MTRVSRVGLWAGLALIALAAITWAGAHLWASQRRQAADRAWAASAESMDALMARYPATPDSPAARQLASLARRVGLMILPPSGDGPAEPARGIDVPPEAAHRFDPIVRFVAEQGSKNDDEGPADMPTAVTDALSALGAGLDAIEMHLVTSGPVTWAIDLRQGLAMPSPQLPAYRYLGSALLARGLQAARAGDGRAAQRSLDAFDALVLALDDRPKLVDQLMVIAMNALRNGVLRQFPATPSAWISTPPSRAHTQKMLRSIQADTLLVATTARGAPGRTEEPEATRSTWVRRVTGRWFLELWLADQSWQVQRLTADLRAQSPCEMDVDELSQRALARIPWWSPYAPAAMPGLARTSASAAGAALDDELTLLVIAAKARKADPAARIRLPETATSTICPGVRWTATTLASGDILIEARSNRPLDPAIWRRTPFRVGVK